MNAETPIHLFHVEMRPGGKTVNEIVAASPHPIELPHWAGVDDQAIMDVGDSWDSPIPHGTGPVVINYRVLKGGGGGLLQVVATLALSVALAIPTGGLSLQAFALQAALLGTSLLVNTLLAPTLPKLDNTPEESVYSSNITGNRARLNDVIPILRGRFRWFPQYAAQLYSEFVGNDEYTNILLSLGKGKVSLEEIGIQKRVFWDASLGVGNEFNGRLDDVQIEHVGPGEQIKLFPDEVFQSNEPGNQIFVQNVLLGPYVACPAGKTVISLAVDTFMPQLNRDPGKKGKLVAVENSYKYEYQEIDDLDVPIGGWLTLAEKDVTRATRQAVRISDKIDVPDARYWVRGTRTDPDVVDPKFHDEMHWGELRGYAKENAAPSVSRLAIRVRASEQLSAFSQRQFFVTAQSIFEVWNGSTFVEQPSSSIAWGLRDIAVNTDYGYGFDPNQIDFDTFEALENKWTARNEFFNGMLDTRRTYWDVFALMARVGRASPVLPGGCLSLIRDEDQPDVSHVFDDFNIRKGSLAETVIARRTNTPDDIIVEYMDSTTWQKETVRAQLDVTKGNNPKYLGYIGITDRVHAHSLADYEVKANDKRRHIISFGTEQEGRLPVQTQRIAVNSYVFNQADSAVITNRSGEVITVSRTLTPGLADPHIIIRDRRLEQWGPCKVDSYSGTSITLNSVDLAAVEAVDGLLVDTLTEGTPGTGTVGKGDLSTLTIGQTSQVMLEMQVATVKAVDSEHYLITGPSYQSTIHDVPALAPDPLPVTKLPITDQDYLVLGLTVFREQGNIEPYLSANWQPFGGASAYILQISYDNIEFRTLQNSPSNNFEGPVQFAEAWVRVAAIVDGVRGKYTDPPEYLAEINSILTEDAVDHDALAQLLFDDVDLITAGAGVPGSISEAHTVAVSAETSAATALILGNQATATGIYRLIAITAPSGVIARFEVQVDVEDAQGFKSAGFMLDVFDAGGGVRKSRMVIKVDEFIVDNQVGGGDPAFQVVGGKTFLLGERLKVGDVSNASIYQEAGQMLFDDTLRVFATHNVPIEEDNRLEMRFSCFMFLEADIRVINPYIQLEIWRDGVLLPGTPVQVDFQYFNNIQSGQFFLDFTDLTPPIGTSLYEVKSITNQDTYAGGLSTHHLRSIYFAAQVMKK